ncbi:hypothetical protein [Streptomyces niveus]|uniref:Vegetative cell wall protein gp1 n=1 Tax=Streptomyces niveus TaxID=193462 RepID=A0A1U9QTH7_STRNV|nr:hypothetical protein [Streptomyces niveus]AQU67369.1 hypothetical protein BBN63_15040 [Streptomyces niveus]
MPGLLAGIGTWIADRWLQTVVLSGMLWVATLVVAARLGQSHAFEAERLHTWLDEIATHRAGDSPAAILLTVAAALLTAGAAGLAAGGLGALLQRLWGADGAGPALAWLLRWRLRWWQKWYSERALRAVTADLAEADPAAATARRARAERALRLRTEREPHRPTRIGDALHAVAVRLRARYALNVDLAWPRLWAVLPDPLRADLSGARAAYDSAARLAGWGVLYAALAVLWWPAALIGAGVLVTAVARARGAAAVLASLVEAAVDLHLTDLADQLGVRPDSDELTELGRAVGRRLGPPTPS